MPWRLAPFWFVHRGTDLLPAVFDPPATRRTWILLGTGWLGVIVALLLWLRTPGTELREQLRSVQFWSLETCLALGVALGAMVLTQIRRRLDRRDVLNLATLAAAALALTLFVAPRTNRIYYDEQIYQSIGQNLADLKLAQMCNDGTVEYGRLQCWLGEYNKQPYAYPHLLSVLYRIFGVSGAIAFRFNAATAAMTVVAIYLLVFIVFADRTAAFFAALVMGLMPEQTLWSATAAVEPSASLACLVALLLAAEFRQSKRTVALSATAVAAVYAVQFRAESAVIVPVVLLMAFHGHFKDELKKPRFWAVGLLALVLASIHLGHLVAVRNEPWGTSDARLSFQYVVANLRVNGWFYLRDERFPILFTILAGVGLVTGRMLAARLVFAVYFALFFAVYLLFYAGSYNYGADVRYSLMTFPPVAVLSGLGVSKLLSFRENRSRTFQSQAIPLATAILVFQWLWYAPLVRATTEEAWAARADVSFAGSFVPEIGPHAYVLTHNPGMFHVWGISAGQMSNIVTNPGQVNFLTTRYREVYLHWNFWCNVEDPLQRSFCAQAITGKQVETVREYRERNMRFAFYRFTTPRGSE
jgi:dolichyl-phosphate-mannose-protein mannosyltransferase